ncbi:unnamed protein product [Dibothriocephalus latus]|uniref:NADP-dependent oxidoreductase domain-containing protein n=1 Tax=Dibothriocephalus latus TaxID=60516 RepID=A0A3P7PVT4_DIBLA|nr:unnamed protein product [Dibothriocephalus latus]
MFACIGNDTSADRTNHQQVVKTEEYAVIWNRRKGDVCHLLDDPIIGKIAKEHEKSPAQVILRHGLQRNLIVIPKSVTPERIQENIKIFDFELTEDEMNSLNSLDKGQRFMDQPEIRRHPDYPFKVNGDSMMQEKAEKQETD